MFYFCHLRNPSSIMENLLIPSTYSWTKFSLSTNIRSKWIRVQSVYPKCHFVFLINWNMKLKIKFWFSFLYWSWDKKHQNKWFSDWTIKFKFEVCFSFFILIWKTKNQIYLNKYLIKLVTRSHYAITINK